MTKSATQKKERRGSAQRFAEARLRGTFSENPPACSCCPSHLGIGTYARPTRYGRPTPKANAAAIVAAVENGINVIDAAINYRFQAQRA